MRSPASGLYAWCHTTCETLSTLKLGLIYINLGLTNNLPVAFGKAGKRQWEPPLQVGKLEPKDTDLRRE